MIVAPQNIVDAEGYALFTVDGNPVLVWKHPPVMAGIDDCKRLFSHLRATRPQTKFGYLAIVESHAGTHMPSDVRSSLSSMLNQFEQSIAGSVVVFEGTGFRAAIVRSVVAAITLASRLDFPATVESDLRVAARWLVGKLPAGGRLQPNELCDTVNQFRSRWNAALKTG